jgi:hypothetical protein
MSRQKVHWLAKEQIPLVGRLRQQTQTPPNRQLGNSRQQVDLLATVGMCSLMMGVVFTTCGITTAVDQIKALIVTCALALGAMVRGRTCCVLE